MRISYLRAMLSGSFVWLLVISTFTILGFIPGMADPDLLQGVVVGFFMLIYSTIAALWYYRNPTADQGLKVGVWASVTALVLDVVITVPFFEMPDGGSYAQFFAAPLLWLLVTINVIVFYAVGKRKGMTGGSH